MFSLGPLFRIFAVDAKGMVQASRPLIAVWLHRRTEMQRCIHDETLVMR